MPGEMIMLRWHRLCAFATLPVMAFIVATGAGIEAADMAAILGHAPETGAEMRKIREHIYGAPNYAVVSATDYDSPALPNGLNYQQQFARTAALARRAMPGGALQLVEIRGFAGRVAGHARIAGRDLIFDLADGRPLPSAALPWDQPPPDLKSTRSDLKEWHRLGHFGLLAASVNALAGLAVVVMMITGLVQYVRLYRARAKIGRHGPFWSGGSRWRVLHRAVALVAALPVLWLVLSGLALAVDNVAAGVGLMMAPPVAHGPDPFAGDFSTPLRDDEMAGMAGATLRAFGAGHPGVGIKVLRLRYFAGYRQGIVIAADADTSQNVYDTATGRALSMDEPGYPRLIFPTGWEWHQRLKRIHRGDFLGMPGRWIASLVALSLLYLMISGAVMYAQLWQRRRKAGRTEWVWK